MKEYLVVLEVAQKQKYIFQTNRLAENIGASIIIRKVTEEMPRKYASPEEFVYSGGGKSLYAFGSRERAEAFISNTSGTVIKECPGIELYMAIQEYDTDSESVIEAIEKLYGKLEAKKASKSNGFMLYGLGITEQCESTQLPAVTRGLYGQPLSNESALKYKEAERMQDDVFSELLPDAPGFRFAREFAELGGTKGSKNYISITVMDGNKMGRKLEKFREDFRRSHPEVNAEFNREYKAAYRKISDQIDDVYRQAVKKAVNRLAGALDGLVRRGVLTGFRKGGKVLPFRPLIQAGDDICFVSDARIGLALTEEVLRNIENEKILGIPMKACAGVAMVKTSYPFFRAHVLAEELCQSAKAALPSDDSKDAAVLDFHIVQGEISGFLTEIRKNLYRNNTLTSKPYYLDRTDGPVCMDLFKERLEKVKKYGRGVIKEYRSALSGGEQEADRYLVHKRLDNFGPSYFQGRCVDFDVIEMMDIYHELEES